MTYWPQIPERVLIRIFDERDAGRSYRQIADGLMRDSIPTARGSTVWWPTTVHHVIRRLEQAGGVPSWVDFDGEP